MATLKEKFEELIHKDWSQFVDIEKSGDTTVDEATLCALVRACTDTNNSNAIKTAFDRIDGMLETPVEIKVPKFYIRYINAESIEQQAPGENRVKLIEGPENGEKTKSSTYDPATAKLRETLLEMREMPRQIIALVLENKRLIEENQPTPHDPMVKSVIVANLLRNASKGKMAAIDLIFDQIDGKLTRTITLLGGEDVYVDDYLSKEAPVGAIKDESGYYIAEDKSMTTAWLRGFSNSQKGLEILAEGLDERG